MFELVNDYPLSWEIVKLGDFVDYEKGKKPKHQQEIKDSRYCYPYIDIEAFEKNIIKTYADGTNCKICSEDDFLMVWDGSRSGLVGKGMNGALGSTLVRINFPHIFNNYAFYFLLSKYIQINSRAKGSGTPHVDPDLLWNYKFPVAPINEQHRIVSKIEELFSELDKGIESLKTAREQLKIYRQALLKHAFEGKLTEQWRKDNAEQLETADQLLERIKQEREERYQQHTNDWKEAVKEWESKGKEEKKPRKPVIPKVVKYISDDEQSKLFLIPKKYKWCRFGNVYAESVLGKMLDKKKNKGNLKPYLRNINVRWGRFDLSDILNMRFEVHELKRYTVSKGDLVICEGGEPGRCAIWEQEKQEFLIQKALHRVRLFKYLINPKFIYYFIMFSANQGILSNYFTGTTIKHLTGASLSKLPIPLSSFEEQNKIVQLLDELLSVVDNSENEIENNLICTESLRQSILKKAFSGKLIPQDPNDEPASELLKRIAQEKATIKKVKQKPKRKKSVASGQVK